MPSPVPRREPWLIAEGRPARARNASLLGIILLAAALVLPPWSGAQGQTAKVADVSWEPATLSQGTLVRLGVRPAPSRPGVGEVTTVTATLAGEPVHFHLGEDGLYLALAGLPFGAESRLPLLIHIRREHWTDTLTVNLPVAAGRYPSERLTVAPRFGREPDRATAARIKRENGLAREVGRHSHETPRLWEPLFILPGAGALTARFGTARSFNGRIQSRHMGTDFAGRVGDPVRAPSTGVVALIDHFYLAGTVLYLDHGEGLTTGYFHLSEVDVAPGDTVRAGQVIARVGQSGRVTGPHLHWVMRYGTISVDPLSLSALGLLEGAPSPASGPHGSLGSAPAGGGQ
jgi:murein DD-endopeptidase MepM/ murein hydrolase activator NlpD